MRAHLVQMDIAWEDRQANFRTVERMLDAADLEPGDLVVLPELFDSGFSLNVEITCDDPPYGSGETRGFLSRIAQQRSIFLHGSWTGLSADSQPTRGFNMASMFAPNGREVYRYAKIHPFTYGREGERFDGGVEVICENLGAHGAQEPLRVCPAICYDLRFPELFRLGLDGGADTYVIGANWPDARQFHWRALSVARAIENQAWVLCVNRVGQDPHLSYAGGSMIIDPQGNILKEADHAPCVLSAPIHGEAVANWRKNFPAWRDRSERLAHTYSCAKSLNS